MRIFPDIQWNNRRILVSGNILVAEWVSTGTQQEEFLGFPPSGKGGDVSHLNINEYEGGKLKRTTTYLDYVTVLVLIGAMPANELPPLVPSFELPDPEPTGLSPLRAAYTEEITRWNAGDMTAYARGFHEDAVIKYAPFGMVPMSREQHIAIQELYLLAFPDRYMDVIRRVDLGDGWVLTEVMFEATNTGPFFGLPATGQPVHFKGAWIGRFDADGLRTEISYYYDSLTMLTQLGLVPAP